METMPWLGGVQGALYADAWCVITSDLETSKIITRLQNCDYITLHRLYKAAVPDLKRNLNTKNPLQYKHPLGIFIELQTHAQFSYWVNGY